MKLYEILVPDDPDEDLRTHLTWDAKVIELAGGLTLLKPIKGRWQGSMLERSIPVRIATTPEKMREVALMTKEHYKQDAVIYYEISPNVEFV